MMGQHYESTGSGMADQGNSKQELIEELAEMRRRVALLETALQENQSAAALLQIAPLGIYELGTTGRIMFVNPSQEAITGYTADELLGSYAWDRIEPGPERDSLPAYLEHLVSEQPKPTPFFAKNIRKNGEVFDVRVDWNYKRNSQGQVTGFVCLLCDITEKKRAEEALRQSEERFRLLVEAIPQPIWRSDADGNVLEFNRRWHEYTGQTAEEAKGSGWTKALHSDEAAIVVKKVRAGITSGAAIEIVNRLRRASDGSYRWHLARAVPMNDRGGKIIGWFGCATDIDDQKRAEEALRQSEEALQKAHDELEQRVEERTAELAKANESLRQSHGELQAIYDGMADGMLVADIETTRFYAANAAMARMLGYSDTELRSLSVKDIHPQADLPFVVEQFQGLAEGKIQVSEEVPVLRKDGSVFYALVTSSKFTHDARPCVVGFFRDVTERRRAEEALRASEERYGLAVRGAGVGIWDYDIYTGKVYYSPRWKSLFGYDEQDIGDTLDDWARLLHPDERDWILKFQDDFLAGTSPTVTVEYRLRHKDGSYRWIVAHGLVVRDEQGKAYRFVGSHGDITDRKRAEEALAKEHRNLRHMLRSSDNERQLIAYEIHDGLAQQLAGAIMQFQAYEHLKDTQPKQAANAYHAGLTMLQQGHFETRRLIAGVRPPILDESGVVEAIAHLVHEQGRDKGPKIENRSRVDFDRLDPTLENAIYRIAQEALTNACKHSQSERVQVSLLQREDRLRVEIQDWGVGFDPKTAPKNRFGLEGIRQRARLLGGKCIIRSTAGKGTRITVELPVIPRDEEE
jgi:PAS domain S-box-containing protein